MKMQPIQNKLDRVYKFLLKHRSYNTTVRKGFYKESLAGFMSWGEKLISLIYKIQETQSRPNLDNVATFWKKYYKSKPGSFHDLIQFIDQSENSYMGLYNSVIRQASFGPKVTALFTKIIYHIHCDTRYTEFRFLDDVPPLRSDDELYLPIDSVIINFFKHVKYPYARSFANLNNYLQVRYPGKRMEVWDDLWFWGFIGQKGGGENRVPEWNESKFWAIPYVDRSKIDEVCELVEEFVRIIKE